MVHRTHLKVFDNYYPKKFSAWYIDDWITKVYEPGRSTKRCDWVVRHHNSKHGTLYKIQWQEKTLLTPSVEEGKNRIKEWLLQKSTPIKDPVNLCCHVVVLCREAPQ